MDPKHVDGACTLVYQTLRRVLDPHADGRGQGQGQGGEEDTIGENERRWRENERVELVRVGSWSSKYSCNGALIGIGVDSECWGVQAGETCLIHATLLPESKEAWSTLEFNLFLV